MFWWLIPAVVAGGAYVYIKRKKKPIVPVPLALIRKPIVDIKTKIVKPVSISDEVVKELSDLYEDEKAAFHQKKQSIVASLYMPTYQFPPYHIWAAQRLGRLPQEDEFIRLYKEAEKEWRLTLPPQRGGVLSLVSQVRPFIPYATWREKAAKTYASTLIEGGLNGYPF